MNYTLKEPCAECPYVGKMPGWIGSHESPEEFVDLVRADVPFSCHMTVQQPGGVKVPASKEQHCAGYALFMSKMCKVSRRREMADMQARLRKDGTTAQVLFPPHVLIQHHTVTRNK